jgi:hypothetical protein
MIEFIGASLQLHLVTINTTHAYKQHSNIADLHTFQFTPAHALGFSISTSHCPAVDLNTEIIISNHYEIFSSFLLRSTWNADPILQSLWFWTLLVHSTNLYSTNIHDSLCPIYNWQILIYYSRYIVTAQTHIAENTSRDRCSLLCDVNMHAQAVRALHNNGPCADTKKILPPYCCMMSLRMRERVYRAVAWQCVTICCSLIGHYQPFRVTCFVHHQGRRVQVAGFSRMMAVLHQPTWYHRPKESNLYRHIHENFKPLY